ncbi:MAG: hypothetical protein JEZ06_23770 [Anaerolineaceae bacterium]|nr:hypothetical protein [Anaerolineaceae bacterium]
MKCIEKIPEWGWVLIFLLSLPFFPFVGIVFRRVPLAFFFLWIGCPCLAWGLRFSSLDNLLTSRGYSISRGVLVGIAVFLSLMFWAHFDYFNTRIQFRYTDPVKFQNTLSALKDAAIHREETGKWPDGWADGLSGSSYSDKGRIIVYVFPRAMLVMIFGIPFITFRITSTAIRKYERRKRESNYRIDSGDV